jgi:hypothetical protein
VVEARLAKRTRLSDSRAVRRRLPSPALVIASVALFVALGGAGFAASLALVKAPQPVTLVSGGVGTDGKATGAGLSGGRKSQGVYVITIRGDMFAPASASRHLRDKVEAVLRKGVTTIPPQCGIASENLTSNGGGKVEVDCFEYNPAVGWLPTDTAFDLLAVGPSR